MAISVSCYFAIALLTTIFIFPETMNHSILNDVSEQLDRIKALLLAQDEVLAMRSDNLQEEMAHLNTKTKKDRSILVTSQTQRKFSKFLDPPCFLSMSSSDGNVSVYTSRVQLGQVER